MNNKFKCVAHYPRAISLLFLHENLCCGSSLESSQQDDSHELQQYRFSLQKGEKYFLIKVVQTNFVQTDGLCAQSVDKLISVYPHHRQVSRGVY